MKRTRHLALVLLSGASAGTFSGCDAAGAKPVRISSQCAYENNTFVPGVGYYHAPFYKFYAHPYNWRDPKSGLYFAGGQWRPEPNQSVLNLSSPTETDARIAEAARTDVDRGGFGRGYGGGWG